MLHRGQCLQRRLPVGCRLAEVDYLRVPEHDADFVTGCDGLADEILRPADRLQDGLAVHGPAYVDAEHHDTAAEAVLQAAEIPPGRYLCQPGRRERAPDPVSHLYPRSLVRPTRAARRSVSALSVTPSMKASSRSSRLDRGSCAMTVRRPSTAIRMVMLMTEPAFSEPIWASSPSRTLRLCPISGDGTDPACSYT